MSIIQTLMEKPWIPQAAGVSVAPSDNSDIAVGKTALKFLLAIVTVIFLLFIITFLSRTQLGDFETLAGEPWKPFTNPTQLWLNTGFLLLASFALQWTKYNIHHNRVNNVIVGIALSEFFALLFLVGQIFVWRDLVDQGYFITSNPANSYYYVFTSIHGLHILGGVVALVYVTLKFIGHSSAAKLSEGIDLCTTYWHYLFIIWLFLFALLTSSAETFNLIAKLCGF